MLLRLFLIFSFVALMPIFAGSLVAGFVSFDLTMINPQTWSRNSRGLSIGWVIVVYGIYSILWVRVKIDDITS